MKDSIKTGLKGLAVLMLVVAMILTITDCVGGVDRYLETSVVDKVYVAAWTEIWTTYDEDGHPVLHTVHHPEEWHVIVDESGATNRINVSTSSGMFAMISIGQQVTVKVRSGRWSHIQWMPTIVP